MIKRSLAIRSAELRPKRPREFLMSNSGI
jgi:hypothetical protein